MPLARTHNLSAYDASYVELAKRHGLSLAALDGKLKTVAVNAGVGLYTPPSP